MTAYLRVRDSQGRVTFDSDLVVGGVPLGFYTIPSDGASVPFTDFVGFQGIAIFAGGGRDASMLYQADNNLGYLRFTFSRGAGLTVLLFAK